MPFLRFALMLAALFAPMGYFLLAILSFSQSNYTTFPTWFKWDIAILLVALNFFVDTLVAAPDDFRAKIKGSLLLTVFSAALLIIPPCGVGFLVFGEEKFGFLRNLSSVTIVLFVAIVAFALGLAIVNKKLKKRCLTLVAMAVLATALPGVASAAEPKDVAEVVKIMCSDSTKNIIERKRELDGGAQIVFIAKGLRYTMYYAGPGWQYLSVWVRPNGTRGQEKVETFTDHGLDGIVDFGIGHRGLMRFDRKVSFMFGEYWQLEYNDAIKAALRRLK